MAGPYVAAAIAATVLFGLAAVALKVGVSRGFPELSVSAVLRNFFPIVWKLLRNWIWLLGLALNGLGGIFYFVALAKLDLTIVKPIITFYVVVAAVLGAVLLEEKVSKLELVGIVTAVCGAALLGVHGEAMTGDVVAIATQYRGMHLVLAGSVAVSLLVALPMWVPAVGRYVSREISLSLIAGIYWGLGAAYYKLFANEMLEFPSVLAAGGLVPAAGTGAFWVDLVSSLALWLMLALNVLGFAVYQIAFANGRVAVVAPVVMVATLLAPVVGGVWVYGEDLPAIKIAAIAIMVLGTAVLSFGKEGGGAEHGEP